jgi:DNA mismatch repair ATPase MutS
MQSLDTGLSTFGSEISSMIEILKHCSSRGVILIDELARGTNPKEGYAISRAIVKYLKDSEAVTLFTTHFDGITMEDGVEHLQVRGLKDVDFDSLADKLRTEKAGINIVLQYMDYSLEKIEENHNVPMDAINIAKLMGLDDSILIYAEKMLNEGKEE